MSTFFSLTVRLMSRAKINPIPETGRWHGWINFAAHRAYAKGDTQQECIENLRALVAGNAEAIAKTFRILSGEEP